MNKRLTPFLALAAAAMLPSCVVPMDPGPPLGPRRVVTTDVGYYTTVPVGYTSPTYYYGNRHYYGGRYDSGRYYHRGRQYDGRYYHNGRYIYGGRYHATHSHNHSRGPGRYRRH